MRRLELFKALCEATGALEHAQRTMVYSATREAVSAVVARLDGLIDRCVREGMEPLHAGDTSPCPACGQASCTHWQVVRQAPSAKEAP